MEINNLIFNLNKNVNFKINKTNDEMYNNILFNEKYRPTKLKHMVLDKLNKNKLNNIINNKESNNMIIVGPTGIGKTSLSKVLANEYYGKYYNEYVIEFNSSDNRGLETINNSIIFFCKKKISNKLNLPKLVILDEADNITKKAQFILSTLIESFDLNTKFILICNNFDKIIESIQTRSLILRLNSISNDMIKLRLKYICKNEKIEFDEEGLELISNYSRGDLRSAINYLEITYHGFNKINCSNINKICDKPNLDFLKNIIDNLLNNSTPLIDEINKIIDFKNKGYCNNDIVLSMLNIVKLFKYDNDIRLKLYDILNYSLILINDKFDTDLQLLNIIVKIYNINNKSNNNLYKIIEKI